VLAEQVYARRPPVNFGWYLFASGPSIPPVYNSMQAACDAVFAANNCIEGDRVGGASCWNKHIDVTSDHSAECMAKTSINPDGATFASPFYGAICPDRYTIKGFVDARWLGWQSVYYGPAEYCESSWSVLDRWHDKPASGPQVCGGNPIFPLTGTKRQKQALMQWSPGMPPLSLTFDNRRKLPNDDAAAGFAPTAPASFGGLWESSLHKKLVVQMGNHPYFREIQASRGAGVWASFPSYAGADLPDLDIQDRLAPMGDGWLYADAGAKAQEIYDGQGTLTAIRHAAGGGLTYGYSDSSTPVSIAPAAGLLIKVQDQYGRAVRFDYEQPAVATTPRIVRVTDADGRIMLVGYDAVGNLSHLTWPDGKVRQFLYEQSALPWALTGIVDENEERHSVYGYDAEGRAQSTEYVGGANRYSLSYDVGPRWITTETFDGVAAVFWRDHNWRLPQGAAMTTPNGSVVNLEAVLINGMPRVTARSQPAGAGCDASTSRLTYDANGNVASKTDFNGTKSCHAYDLGRNLETVRVEGLDANQECGPMLQEGAALPANSRKTVTQWHPDWQLATAVAAPKSLTTYVYNGQPDPFSGNVLATCASAGTSLPDGKPLAVLCKRVEQITADVDGHRGFALDASPATPADAAFSSVAALLHLDGANGSTALVDSGPASHRWTTTGTTAISTLQSRFGKASLVAGSGAAQSTELNDVLFGSGDFTVEAWVYKTGVSSAATIAALWAPEQCSWWLGSNGSNQLAFYTSTAGCSGNAFPAMGTIPQNVWTHVAVSRAGAILLFFINGTQVGSAAISDALFASSGINVTVGAQGNLVNQWPGYIDEVRLTKGVARYTSSFGVPNAPFSDSAEGMPAVPSMIDEAVPARTSSYFYNELGQLLTARDPLNKLTAYAYYGDTTDQHTMGDLQSVTDSAGRITQYTRYDKSGRLMQSADANGTLTDTTYTPRGWVKTVTVTAPGAAAQAALYDYDGVGQLKKATLPDGSALEYTYDAAHRLTSIKDAAGNSMTYTLDNMGNRTEEDLKDPSGTLARNITRVYDALNRVQGATGVAQ